MALGSRRVLGAAAAALAALAVGALALRDAGRDDAGAPPALTAAAAPTPATGGEDGAVEEADGVPAAPSAAAASGATTRATAGVLRARVTGAGDGTVSGVLEGSGFVLPALADRPVAGRYTGPLRTRPEPAAEEEIERAQEEDAGVDEGRTAASEAEAAARQALAKSRSAAATAGRGTGGSVRPHVYLAVDAVDVREGQGYYPADPSLDVGPGHVVVMVNAALVILDKAGRRVAGPVRLADFFMTDPATPCASDAGDVLVLYDQLAGRWLVTQFTLPLDQNGAITGPNQLCVAISNGADPVRSTWLLRVLPAPGGGFVDYPKWGVMPDGYYLGAIAFDGGLRPTPLVAALDRDDMLRRDPAAPVRFEVAPVQGTALEGPLLYLPADLDGAAAPPAAGGLFAGIADDGQGGGADALRVLRLTPSWAGGGGAGIAELAALPTGGFSGELCGLGPGCVAQRGSPYGLDALADRAMQRASYRRIPLPDGTARESLVVVHTVDATGGDVAGVRWYEVRDPSTAPRIAQRGTYRPADPPGHPARERWMGTAAINDRGAIALGYTRSGPADYPSAVVAGRADPDPPGVLGRERVVRAGTGPSVTPGDPNAADWLNRWGDYAQMAVDPVDDCSFWLASMASRGRRAGWVVSVSHLRIGSCAPTRPPRFETPPRVRGVPRVGHVVRCDVGRATAVPGVRAHAIAWLRDGREVARGPRVRLGPASAGARLACRVRAISLLGSATATSPAVRVRRYS